MGKRACFPYLFLKNRVSCGDSYETMRYIPASEATVISSRCAAADAGVRDGTDKQLDGEFKSRKAPVGCTRHRSEFRLLGVH
jgi:hypothetical protein